MLIIGNTGDSITPLRWAEAMVEDFDGAATLLTWDAIGHVAFSFGSTCIDEHTITYLLELELPPADTVCGIDGQFGVQVNPNLEVDEVTPGSGADLAGIQQGDRIISIDRTPVATLTDVAPPSAGVATTLEVDRDGTILEFTATPELPPWELWRLAE